MYLKNRLTKTAGRLWKGDIYMTRTLGIGHQNFEQLITNDYFYIDKTGFIKEWWERGDSVTLITDSSYEVVRKKLCQILTALYSSNRFLLEGELLDNRERNFFESVSMDMESAFGQWLLVCKKQRQV